MKYFRYISEKELESYLSGKTLTNNRDFGKEGNKTNSSGFCFLRENTAFTDGNGKEHDFSPQQCLSFLFGIVSEDLILAEFDTEEILRECFGIYADPVVYGKSEIRIKEYCINSYSTETFQLVRYSKINFFGPEVA